jgi:ankyrin repeat protein
VKWKLEKNSEAHYITDQDGIRRIHSFTHKSDEQNIVQLLVENGVNVKAANKYSETALHYAVTFSKWDVVKYLIEEGAEVNNLPSDQRADLSQYAEANGHKDIINLLNLTH